MTKADILVTFELQNLMTGLVKVLSNVKSTISLKIFKLTGTNFSNISLLRYTSNEQLADGTPV